MSHKSCVLIRHFFLFRAWLLDRNVIIKATKEYNGNKYRHHDLKMQRFFLGSEIWADFYSESCSKSQKRLKISEIQDVDEDSKYFWNSSHSLNYSREFSGPKLSHDHFLIWVEKVSQKVAFHFIPKYDYKIKWWYT